MLGRIGLFITIFCGSFAALGQRAGQQVSRPPFHEDREAASDLEVTGLMKGVPAGQSRFVSREWLASLPQTSLKLMRSEDFPGIPKTGVMLSGVPLDALARRLRGGPDVSAIEAVCADGYTATYSREYVRQHHPLFVLMINGLTPHAWAIKNDQYDAEPYFISYQDFIPAFQVLMHKDRALEPTGIVRLRFGIEEQVYGAIKSKALEPKQADGSRGLPVTQGYRIARQNCLRCHNAGEHGGTKAGKNWSTVGGIAKNKPEWFTAWVHDPQAIDPKAKMPANLDYDKATLNALQRYFATFAASSTEGQ